ncbi:hypothetical protein, partial [Cupriavidus lacunae]
NKSVEKVREPRSEAQQGWSLASIRDDGSCSLSADLCNELATQDTSVLPVRLPAYTTLVTGWEPAIVASAVSRVMPSLSAWATSMHTQP